MGGVLCPGTGCGMGLLPAPNMRNVRCNSCGVSTSQFQSNKPVSESCAVAKSEKFWWASGQSNLAYKLLAAARASKVWFLCSHNYLLASGTVFHSHQNFSFLATAHDCETGLWSSLPFCLPSLIVQWPTRNSHFQPLRMIVKLAYCCKLQLFVKLFLNSYTSLILHSSPLRIPSSFFVSPVEFLPPVFGTLPIRTLVSAAIRAFHRRVKCKCKQQ